MTALLNEIISLLVGGIAAVGEGVGKGVNDIVTNLFTSGGTGEALGLSTFGGIAVIWGGIALAVGLCKRILIWVTSFGN